MINVIIENAVQIVAALLLMLIGVMGTWLTAKIGKRAELGNIAMAMEELFDAVSCTVADLQQTVVDGMKSAAIDGKLTDTEILQLTDALYTGALKRLSPAAYNLINATGMDLRAIIAGMGNKAIINLKK